MNTFSRCHILKSRERAFSLVNWLFSRSFSINIGNDPIKFMVWAKNLVKLKLRCFFISMYWLGNDRLKQVTCFPDNFLILMNKWKYIFHQFSCDQCWFNDYLFLDRRNVRNKFYCSYDFFTYKKTLFILKRK